MKKSKKIFPIFLSMSLVIASFACSASAGISDLFATPTPTVTATFTPSPTPVPTDTATLTPTTTPLPSGVTSEEQPDGSTLVVDYDNNYKFILPAEWVVLPLESEDFAAILDNMADENPELADIARNFKTLESDAIRIIALNKDSKYIRDEFATNITVVAFEDKVMTAMPIEFITGALEESLTDQGATVLTNDVNVKSTSNGIETGVIDVLQRTPTASGKQVEVLSRVVLFKSESRLVMITLAVHEQFGDELLPVLDPILDSIDTLSP